MVATWKFIKPVLLFKLRSLFQDTSSHVGEREIISKIENCIESCFPCTSLKYCLICVPLSAVYIGSSGRHVNKCITYLNSVPRTILLCQVITANKLPSDVVFSTLFLCSCITICSLQHCSLKFTASYLSCFFFSLHVSNKTFDNRLDIRIFSHHLTLFDSNSIRVNISLFAHP